MVYIGTDISARSAPITALAGPVGPCTGPLLERMSRTAVEVALERMRRTAVSELGRHLPDGLVCDCCGEVWPCGRARQADMALS
jgi:hypothetical protein